ncbi:MAG: EpsG family protein, partial [Arenimonas sp.]|nr:EpsG family protein [Arenimonas sp.]
RKLWLWIAVFAVVCLPLVGLASTAVDRVALYLIPLQLFVFSRIPLLATTVKMRTFLVVAVIAYYALVQFVWLNFATHAYGWVPYKFMPLG